MNVGLRMLTMPLLSFPVNDEAQAPSKDLGKDTAQIYQSLQRIGQDALLYTKGQGNNHLSVRLSADRQLYKTPYEGLCIPSRLNMTSHNLQTDRWMYRM